MKQIYIKFGSLCLGALAMASCVDDDVQQFLVDKPESIAQYEYLNAYDALKTYVDRDAHPGFKVSGALTASEYTEKGILYRLANSNFDEIVAGNAMKMASVVDEKTGAMNFDNVSAFVDAASDAGISVYGHTLLWHSQQPAKWLNSLIADKPKPYDPSTAKKNKFISYTQEAKTNAWDKQAIYDLPAAMEKGGTYTLSLKAKGKDSEGKVAFWPIWNASDNKDQWGGSSDLQYLEEKAVTTEWSTISWTWETAYAEDCIQLVFGTFEGAVFFDDVVLTKEGSDENLVACGNFEDGKMDGWRNNWQGPTYQIEEEILGESTVEYKDVWTAEDLKFITRDKTHADTEAEVIAGAGPDGLDVIKVTGKTETTNSWSTQFFINTPGKKWEAGEKYRLHMWYKASKEIGTDSQVHGAPGGYIHWAMLSPNPSFTTEWQEKTWEATIPAEGGGNQQTIAFNMNKNRTEKEDVAETVDQIDYYFAGITWESCTQVEVPKVEEVTVNKRCLIIETADKVKETWESQFWIQTNEPFSGGDTWEFEAEVRADIACAPGTQCHKGGAGNYVFWAAIGNPTFTTEWETVKLTGTIPAEGDGCDFIAWNLNDCAEANTFYIGKISFKINGKEMLNNCDLSTDDVSSFWKKEKQGATIHAPISNGYSYTTEVKNTVPLTQEEITDTLTFAMNKWMTGMMQATKGKVKAWDLINEAMAGDGQLQHATEGSKDFFWQDHLGDVEYGVIAVNTARKAYASVEGTNPSDLKLFINDYNLEWQTAKLDGMIKWIENIEKVADTIKIDGIGTQMHISLYLNEQDHEEQKKGITAMFKKMADTGKLVRISELDMGICEKAFGDPIATEKVTFEQHKMMADFYQWIISEYMRVVPAAQQYGICQWCITDASGNITDEGGWRNGQPVGLWTKGYTSRKPAYAGWAEGLKSK